MSTKTLKEIAEELDTSKLVIFEGLSKLIEGSSGPATETIMEIMEAIDSLFSNHSKQLSTALENEINSQTLKTAFNALNPGFALFDQNENLILCNKALQESLNLPSELVEPGVSLNEQLTYLGQAGEFDTDDYSEKLLTSIRSAIDYPVQLDHFRPNGQVVEIRCDSIGEIGFTLSIRDISEIKNKEAELTKALQIAEHANQAKSEFMSAVSHELRTPMNGVIGMTELLLQSELDQSQKNFAKSIQESALALQIEINEILTFSDLEFGKVKVQSEKFELTDVIEATLLFLRDRATQKNLPLNYNIDPQLPSTFIGDSESFRKILKNLLSNALKFTEKGHVDIRISQMLRTRNLITLKLEVTDTGIGIKPEIANNLFSAFTQGDSSVSRQYGGMGIGLTLCQKLVELLKGEIGFTSELGKGSSFWVTIPFTVPEEAAQKPKAVPTSKEMPLSSEKLILVADDNDINRKVAQGLLSSIGYDSETVADGLEALNAVQNKAYAAVLMDVEMPRMDGIEATKSIRALQGNEKDIVIIAVTGHASPEDFKKFKEQGATDCLAKPIKRETLDSILKQWTSSGPNSASAEPPRLTKKADIPVGAQINNQTLDELRQALGNTVLSDLMTSFVEDSQLRQREIKRAVEANDIPLLEKECHSLQGAAGNMGVIGVSNFARNIVALCRTDKGGEALALALEIDQHIDDCFAALAKRGFK